MNELKVIDFFCGAGGFSEGFRQMGYKILYGFDHWNPAVETYNFNFNLKCKPKNILDFYDSTEEIEMLPNTEIIIGSPPCVSFSTSNKSGNSDKSLGVKLSETFLRIVAVKKHQPSSILKAWLMENVSNSKKFLKPHYTFIDLNLEQWANKFNINPSSIAISLEGNSEIINSAEYGSFQARKRVIIGEFISEKRLLIPIKTHNEHGTDGKFKYRTLQDLKSSFVSPFYKNLNSKIYDPQYSTFLLTNNITDHFYDTGIYKVEWSFSKFWKTNHPYMGKMSFPENENKPSRTITATKIANSRESIIYKSEFERIGNGEYRLPTVREAAIIMGFPITYQFLGGENTKWRLVGNAVCCSVSRAFAQYILKKLKLNEPEELIINKPINYDTVANLNTFTIKVFDKSPTKKKGARFRRHLFKDGNLTVSLSNYNIENSDSVNGKWYTSIQYGTGKGFPIQHVDDGFFEYLEKKIIELQGLSFISYLENYFFPKVAKAKHLQEMYELQQSSFPFLEPTELINELAQIFQELLIERETIVQEDPKIFVHKLEVPRKQLFALYAINRICSIANLK